MAHEILSIKLCELEDQIARMISRIRLSETADLLQLRRGIEALTQECAENELTLQKKLQLSRAEVVCVISRIYAQIEQAICQGNDALQARATGSNDADALAEEKILLAEYALDFAMQAANCALLLSMEAIDAQKIYREQGGTLS